MNCKCATLWNDTDKENRITWRRNLSRYQFAHLDLGSNPVHSGETPKYINVSGTIT